MENKQKLTDQDAGQVSGGSVNEYIKDHSTQLEGVADGAIESVLDLNNREYGALKKLWKWIRKLF